MPGLSKPILAGPVKVSQIKSIHGNYHISIIAQKYNTEEISLLTNICYTNNYTITKSQTFVLPAINRDTVLATLSF